MGDGQDRWDGAGWGIQIHGKNLKKVWTTCNVFKEYEQPSSVCDSRFFWKTCLGHSVICFPKVSDTCPPAGQPDSPLQTNKHSQITSDSLQVKVAKRPIPNGRSQVEPPGRKMPSDRFEAGVPKRTFPGEIHQTKDEPQTEVPTLSSK